MIFIKSIKYYFQNRIKSRSNAYIILGMHRSGTSLVSRILDSKGILFDNISKKSFDSNKFGHYECKVLLLRIELQYNHIELYKF